MIIKYLLWKVLGLLAKASLKLLDAGGFLSLIQKSSISL